MMISKDVALAYLYGTRKRMTWHEFNTIRGQIRAGDVAGTVKGIEKILGRRIREQAAEKSSG